MFFYGIFNFNYTKYMYPVEYYTVIFTKEVFNCAISVILITPRNKKCGNAGKNISI